MPIDSSILAAVQGERDRRKEPMLVNPSRLPNTGSFSMGAVPRFWFCSTESEHFVRSQGSIPRLYKVWYFRTNSGTAMLPRC
jgi:hypothetical protein